MTTFVIAAGCAILAGVLGFVLGQRQAQSVEAVDTLAYAAELARLRRRLEDAESRARSAEIVERRARRKLAN